MMFWTSYTEEVDRTEPKAVAFMSIERKLDLLVAVLPCAIAHLLEASEIRRTRTKKYMRLVANDCHL